MEICRDREHDTHTYSYLQMEKVTQNRHSDTERGMKSKSQRNSKRTTSFDEMKPRMRRET